MARYSRQCRTLAESNPATGIAKITPPALAIAVPAAENARMRVYRYELAPGASSVQHSHARPYMLIAATDVDLRMTAPGGASSQHPVKAGDMHWVDSAVTHTLENRGTKNAILVEIEIK